MPRITVLRKVLASNDALAEAQRRQLEAAHVVGINIMSAPGSGKTTLVERTVDGLRSPSRNPKSQVPRIFVVEGDIKGDLDARRVAAHEVNCVQINTQGDCHIDSLMLSPVIPLVLKALTPRQSSRAPRLPSLLIIENVGNLVCPAEFQLPTHYNVTILSTPEGSDKPTKYPLMFSKSDLLIINKIDLLPYVDFNFRQLEQSVKRIKPNLPIIRLSTRTGEGLDSWFAWLKQRLSGKA
jgi:hydrogenase nickel incorporation protein HypB